MDEWQMEQAQKVTDLAIERAIEASRRNKEIAPTGACFNCGAKLPKFSGKRWCDTDCREDWEARQK